MRNIYNNGEAVFSLVDGERVSVFSDSSVNFYVRVGRPNTASQWKLVETIEPGSIWTSGAVSVPTVCRLLATEALVHYEIGADPKTGSVLWGTIGGTLSDQADLDARFSDLEDTYVYYEIYQSIGAGTTGALTVPTGADILLDHYSGGADCVLVAVDSEGLPSDQSPRTVGGVVVTSTLTASGDYVFSGIPSAYPVALVYFIRIPLSLNGNIDATRVVQCWDTAEAINISFYPTGSIAATNVQDAIEELGAEKLSSVSVSLPITGNGTPSSPLAIPALVGGLDTQVQFNDGGALAGDSKFKWNKTASALQVGDNPALLPDNPLAIQANVDTYLQVNIQNTSTGTGASSDYVLTADNGDDESHYFDIGINGSNYSDPEFPLLGANDAYIYSPDHDIIIGTAGTGKKITFHTGGQEATNISAEIDDSGINLPTGRSFRINGIDITTGSLTNPMTASGDIIYGGASGTPTRLAKSTDGKVLKLASGIPSWESESGLGDGDKGDITVSTGGTVWTIDSGAVTESKLGLADNTTANVSTLAHGLAPKLPGNTTTFLRGDGTYAAPGGSTAQEDVIGIVVDGAGSAITTGSKGYREIPYACTINSWTILGKESGSCVVDVKRCTYSGFPTTSSIAGTEKPTLSSAQKNQDASLSSWTTSLAAGDILEFVVDSASTLTRITLSIKVTRT